MQWGFLVCQEGYAFWINRFFRMINKFNYYKSVA